MPKIGYLGSKFWKTNVRFEIRTFEIGYKGNFVKIRKLTFFDSKCPYLGFRAQNFRKQIPDLKSAPSKSGTGKISLKDWKVDTF